MEMPSFVWRQIFFKEDKARQKNSSPQRLSYRCQSNNYMTNLLAEEIIAAISITY